MNGNPVVLVNRTNAPLTFTADGRSHALQPGKNYGFLEGHARFAKGQNPLLGSEDYYTLEYQSLVGVEGVDDCDPIPTEVLEAVAEAEGFDMNSMAPEATKNRRKLAASFHPKKGTRIASGIDANAMAVGE